MLRVRAVLVTVLALLLAAAAVSAYARWELRDSQAFAARVGSSLEVPEVRDVLAERLVSGLTGAVAADALAVRPLLVKGVAALASTDRFRGLVEAAVRRRHARLARGETTFTLALPLGDGPVRRAIARVAPRVAARLPTSLSADVTALRPRGIELTLARIVRRVAGLFWWLVAASAAVLAGLAAARPARGRVRGTLADTGLAAAGAGALVLLVLWIVEGIVLAHAAHAADLASSDERAAVAAVWGALFTDLRTAALVAAVAGAAVAALISGGGPAAWLSRAASRVRAAGARPGAWARPAQAVALLALGVALVVAPGVSLRTLAVVTGIVLLVIGAAELAGRAAPGPDVARGAGATPALVVTVVGVVAVAAAAVAVVVPAPATTPPPTSSPEDCNGSRALCGRRLDEVVFPATHNSYAAADEPGWYFANQRFGIERQLRDGIRGLLLDLHYGVRETPRGVVRTDLRYEGSSRNKVARELSPEALRVADRLAGRTVGGELRGTREVFLCHTLCELGSEPVAQELGIIRRFLDAHPRDLLVVFVEPYVAPRDAEQAFEAAGLVPRTVVLQPGRPLPRLGELLDAGKQLVVLAEQDGGTPPWYLDGFTFTQDTPLRREAGEPAELPAPAREGRQPPAAAQPLDRDVPAVAPGQPGDRRTRPGPPHHDLRAPAPARA